MLHYSSLSFTSSNSSFAECVRKHSDLFHTSHNISNCEINGGTYNLRSHNDLPAGKSYSSESCSFTLTTAYRGNGGSICLTGTSANKESTSLIIKGCIFTSCSLVRVSSYSCGGAVYCSNGQRVEIIDSFFDRCGDATNVDQAGGVDLVFVSVPLLRDCTFSVCKSKEDAGGFGLYFCGNAVDWFPVQECRFLSCYCKDSSGAYEYNNNSCRVCSSCLYCSCTSEGSGGASWIYFVRKPVFNEIAFSLYHNGGSLWGKDLFFNDAKINVISHSFTTSTGTDRVYTVENINNHYPNWLPYVSD